MNQYSYSKIRLFEECPYAYKLKYIDKTRVEAEQTIEQFMGQLVHESLEELHQKVMERKPLSLFQIQAKFELQWRKRFRREKLMINDNKNCLTLGLKAIENYFNTNYPFANDHTVALEKKVDKQFDNFNLVGFIDRLEDFGNKLVIHDYKTGKEKLFSEDQLKMYHLLLAPEKDAELVWHFILRNERHQMQSNLWGFENRVLQKINKIESEKNFEKIKTGRCNWCIFKNLCV